MRVLVRYDCPPYNRKGFDMFKKEISMQILAIFLLSIGGLMLHFRIHPLSVSVFNIAPLLVGLMSAFLLPFLFNEGKTVALAFILNIAAIIVGTLAMGAWSIQHFNTRLGFPDIVLQTLLADIIILWAKFPLGLSILRYFRPATRPA